MLRSRLLLATFALVLCVACGEDDPAPSPAPSPTSTISTASDTGSSVPPELAGYSEPERTAYQAAVLAYDSFTQRNDEFYAAGRTTVAAKNYYQHNAIDWSTAWGNLAQIASSKVTVTGSTRTVWTRPRSVELGTHSGDVVTVRRCLDESGRTVTQNGQYVDQPQFKDPHVYTVRLEKRTAETWWRSGIAKQGSTC